MSDQESSTCGYALQTKMWVSDPQGVVWEAFRTLATRDEYGENDLPDELIDELHKGAGVD